MDVNYDYLWENDSDLVPMTPERKVRIRHMLETYLAARPELARKCDASAFDWLADGPGSLDRLRAMCSAAKTSNDRCK
jgi:hypothetical protein